MLSYIFSALTLLVGQQEGHPAWESWLVGCLRDYVSGQGADLHMAQLMPQPFTISCSSKSRLVLPFWCQLTWVILDRIQEGRKMCACVCVCWVIPFHTLCLSVFTQNKCIHVPRTNYCQLLQNAHVETSFGESASRCRLHCLAAHSVMSHTHRPTFMVQL